MSGISTQAKYGQTVEFKGHLIDSLTLSKISDHIETLGGSYELNDIRIGVLRQELSSVNMTLYAPSPEILDAILDDLKPYGAAPTGQHNAATAACPLNGKLPEHAFSLRLPQKVMLHGAWQTIDAGPALVIVIDQEGRANLTDIRDVRQGDQVVIGNHGIEWQ